MAEIIGPAAQPPMSFLFNLKGPDVAQIDKTKWHPMSTAPRDGTEIVIRAKGVGVVAAYYVDCQWLREDCPETGEKGDPTITDCWRRSARPELGDIELKDATGWRSTI